MASPKQRKDDLEVFYERVHVARERLKVGTHECLQTLEELAKLPRPSGSDVRITFRKILEEMGKILFSATEPFLEKEWKERKLNLYFWPGYDSILIQSSGSRRITLEIDHPPDGRIPCGIGFTLQREGPLAYRASNSSIWFERALTVCSDEHGHGAFIPGSTHAWVSQDNLRLIDGVRDFVGRDSQPTDFSERGFLTALDICLSNRSSSKVKYGILGISLKQDEPETWARYIAESLNSPARFISYRDWPTPLDINLENGNNAAFDFRLNLYNIWLAASFDVRWNNDWFEDFLTSLKNSNLGCLAERLSRASTQSFERKPPARRWYTLRLEKSVETTGESQTLGSGMFLSSAELPAVYVFLASSFVNQMYFRMRDLESTINAKRAGEREGETRLLSELKPLAHQLQQALHPAFTVYNKLNWVLTPTSESFLDPHKAASHYIPQTDMDSQGRNNGTPYFNGRYQFWHKWSADKINTSPEAFYIQFACILLAYLSDPILPDKNGNWKYTLDDFAQHLKKVDLGILREFFGETLQKLTRDTILFDGDKTRDLEAFSILKGCVHYPFKAVDDNDPDRLTGPLLALWTKEVQGNLDEDAAAALIKSPEDWVIEGRLGWPRLEVLTSLHALIKELREDSSCNLGTSVERDDSGIVSRVHVVFSKCEKLSGIYKAIKQSTGNLPQEPKGSYGKTVQLAKRNLDSGAVSLVWNDSEKEITTTISF